MLFKLNIEQFLCQVSFLSQLLGCEASMSSETTLAGPCGSATGLEFSGVIKFLEIPYAKPPVGDLRSSSSEEIAANSS
jgi:hypothetical protein